MRIFGQTLRFDFSFLRNCKQETSTNEKIGKMIILRPETIAFDPIEQLLPTFSINLNIKAVFLFKLSLKSGKRNF
jgi:hypothetical protein